MLVTFIQQDRWVHTHRPHRLFLNSLILILGSIQDLLHQSTYQHIPATFQIHPPASSEIQMAHVTEWARWTKKYFNFPRCSSLLLLISHLRRNHSVAAYSALQTHSHARASPRIRPVSTQANALFPIETRPIHSDRLGR